LNCKKIWNIQKKISWIVKTFGKYRAKLWNDSFHYSTYFLLNVPYLFYNSTCLSSIFSRFSLFNLLFSHNFDIFSLFNLPFVE
jgi:hypothetical protein